MKMYSNTLTEADVAVAFQEARALDGQDVFVTDVRSFRARKTSFGIEFYAEAMNGKQATGHRPHGSYPLAGQPRAASWTAYGYVIARLYQKDPDAMIGRYGNAQDFADQVTSYTPRGENTGFLALLKA